LNSKKPLVSICCAAYNHEKYIRDALDGFLMQECDFEYEILIHDDASTDKTADIIREYEAKHPDKIFPIYQKENQYSQGNKYSDLNYERVRGKYVAICEGDDYWIDKDKLSKQIKLMEENPLYELSFHKAKEVNVQTKKEKVIGKYSEKNTLISIESMILKSHGMIPTASLIMTKSVLDNVLEFKSMRPYLTVGDIYFHIFGALKSEKVLFINEVMSVYRYMTPLSWSLNHHKSLEVQTKHIIAMEKSFNELDEITKNKYSYYFKLSICRKLFTQSNMYSIENIPSEFEEYSSKLYKVLNSLKNQNQDYILYGASTSSKLITSFLGKNIICILDSNKELNGTIFEKKTVHNLEYLKNSSDKTIIMSIITRADEAAKILQDDYNIDSKQIILLDREVI
jgi:glycosyltransferase involved in cell wall biosynthesis